MEIRRNVNKRIIGFTMSEDEYLQLRDDYSGICLACGEIRHGDTEPDARKYPCDSCEKNGVFGIEEIIVMGGIVFND